MESDHPDHRGDVEERISALWNLNMARSVDSTLERISLVRDASEIVNGRKLNSDEMQAIAAELAAQDPFVVQSIKTAFQLFKLDF